MRIGHYYPGATGAPSGVVAGIAAWAGAQATAGHEVVVLHDGGRPADDRYGSAELRPVRHVGRGRGRIPVGLATDLRDLDLLVLHEAWFAANPVAARSARRAGVPYLVLPHGVFHPTWIGYLKRPHPPRRAIERAVLRGAAAVHAFFPAEAAHARLIEPSVPAVVAPMGFDVPAERWRPGGDYLAWYGRYAVRNKGIDLLLHAVAALPPARRPRLRLHGVDYEGGYARTRRLVDELGLAGVVEVGGPVWGAAKTDFVLGSAGFVHPSRWDCIPIAVAENLALGVPCLVSDRINPAAQLADAGAALVTTLDPDSFGTALTGLPVRGAELGERGRSFVAREWSWSAVLPDYLDQIGALLGVRIY